MSQIVEGAQEDATVIGFVIQELDENKNVIFQWRSLDHISVLDASDDIDLTSQVIDYIHSNSICIDLDNNLLISSRNLDEITKINRETGEIIWRLGGNKNQFSFINEEYNFYRQHDVRRLENGNILFFDNGNNHSPQFSRAVEYSLDENQLKATKVWEYRNNPDYYSSAMGSARRLYNGNTLINWCRAGYITEVKPDGSKALEIKFPLQLYSYRIFKEDWTTKLFEAENDSIDYGEVVINENLTKSIEIKNNSSNEISLTGAFNSLNEFNVLTIFPIIIPSFGEATIDVEFAPVEAGKLTDTLNIRSDTDSSIVNSQIILKGTGTLVSNIGTLENINSAYSIDQNYPNPFNPITTIRFSIPHTEHVIINVYNVKGELVEILVDQKMQAGYYRTVFNGNGLSSGMYFYKFTAGSFIEVKKMILLK